MMYCADSVISSAVLRTELGDLLYLIRFAQIPATEFNSQIADSNVLTDKEKEFIRWQRSAILNIKDAPEQGTAAAAAVPGFPVIPGGGAAATDPKLPFVLVNRVLTTSADNATESPQAGTSSQANCDKQVNE